MSNMKDHPSPPPSLYGHEEALADDSTQPFSPSSSNIPIARTPRPFRTYEVNSTPYRSEVTSSPQGPNNISDFGFGSVTTVIHIGNGQISEQQSQVTDASGGQGVEDNEDPPSSGPARSSESASVQDDQIKREAESEEHPDDRWSGFHEVDLELSDAQNNRQPTTSIGSQNNIGGSLHSLGFDDNSNMDSVNSNPTNSSSSLAPLLQNSQSNPQSSPQSNPQLNLQSSTQSSTQSSPQSFTTAREHQLPAPDPSANSQRTLHRHFGLLVFALVILVLVVVLLLVWGRSR